MNKHIKVGLYCSLVVVISTVFYFVLDKLPLSYSVDNVMVSIVSIIPSIIIAPGIILFSIIFPQFGTMNGCDSFFNTFTGFEELLCKSQFIIAIIINLILWFCIGYGVSRISRKNNMAK